MRIECFGSNFKLLSIERKIKHVKTEVNLLRGRIKSIQSYCDAEESFVDFYRRYFVERVEMREFCKV